MDFSNSENSGKNIYAKNGKKAKIYKVIKSLFIHILMLRWD